MTYKIIGDSCLDLQREQKEDPHYQLVPLTLQVGEVHVVDDATFDQKTFLEMVKNTPECPKSACPSPELFKEAMHCDADMVFVITLSSKLSGSYNSAVLGAELCKEEYGEKNILVIDSWSASSGELNIALKLQELCEAGLSFEEISKEIIAYRNHMKTYFVLETLDILRKNGRLTGLKAIMATALNIKPIMGAEEGVIVKYDQARGINRALSAMVDRVVKENPDSVNQRLIISHCNNEERANQLKEEFLKAASFKDIRITDTAGVATVYAADGGVIVTI